MVSYKIMGLEINYEPLSSPIEKRYTLNMELKDKGLVVISGDTGTGKTFLLETLAGVITPKIGNVYYKNENFKLISNKKLSKLRKESFGYYGDNSELIDYLNVIENILVPINKYDYGTEEKALILLKRLECEEVAYKYINKLSKGEKKKVLIARAFINKPKVFLGDDIIDGLDYRGKELVTKLLLEYKDESLIIISSNDEEIIRKADKVIDLSTGEIS